VCPSGPPLRGRRPSRPVRPRHAAGGARRGGRATTQPQAESTSRTIGIHQLVAGVRAGSPRDPRRCRRTRRAGRPDDPGGACRAPRGPRRPGRDRRLVDVEQVDRERDRAGPSGPGRRSRPGAAAGRCRAVADAIGDGDPDGAGAAIGVAVYTPSWSVWVYVTVVPPAAPGMRSIAGPSGGRRGARLRPPAASG
jgi:hypothetical protein